MPAFSATTSLRWRHTSFIVAALAIAALVAIVAPAANASTARMPSDQANSSMVAQYGWGAAATVAKRQSNDLLAQYGWGAAATFAKQQKRAPLSRPALTDDLLAPYGWGAAAAYAEAARLEQGRRSRVHGRLSVLHRRSRRESSVYGVSRICSTLILVAVMVTGGNPRHRRAAGSDAKTARELSRGPARVRLPYPRARTRDRVLPPLRDGQAGEPGAEADHGLSECSRGQSLDHDSVVVAQVQIGAPCSSLSIATPLLIRAENSQPLKSPRSVSGWW